MCVHREFANVDLSSQIYATRWRHVRHVVQRTEDLWREQLDYNKNEFLCSEYIHLTNHALSSCTVVVSKFDCYHSICIEHSTPWSHYRLEVTRSTRITRMWCYHHHIRALRHIRESLPDEVVKTVACSVIGSRLDYCNVLLSGMSKSNLTKVQRVQNTLARIVFRRRKFEHITSALNEHRWLPVQYSALHAVLQ